MRQKHMLHRPQAFAAAEQGSFVGQQELLGDLQQQLQQLPDSQQVRGIRQQQGLACTAHAIACISEKFGMGVQQDVMPTQPTHTRLLGQ
jgi:hypothetical protein